MPARLPVPFALRRPFLLFGPLFQDRDRPALERLAAIPDAEAFVWRVLPHAARTFASCIVMLPAPLARAAAVAYLYCRILDTCEDLLPDPAQRDRALALFGGRLAGGGPPEPAGLTLDPNLARDARDAAHILLVNRCGHVDRVYATLPPPVQQIIADLAGEMSAGMRWSSGVFPAQGCVLADSEQLGRYCAGVLGAPIVFVARMLRLRRHGTAGLPEALRADALAVGEFLQLANITRDIEKDLDRGIAYHPSLRPFLEDEQAPGGGGEGRDAAVQAVRSELLDRALALVPAYRRLLEGLCLRRLSLARASVLLMLLYTERYYRSCARRCGRGAGGPLPGGVGLLLRACAAFWSRRSAERTLVRCEQGLRTLATSSIPTLS